MICPQITKIDVMNAINNMTSHNAFVYRDEKLRVWFYISVCCGVSGEPNITCGYNLGNVGVCCDMKYGVIGNIENFNRDVRKYYEDNWYKEQFKGE